MRLQGATEVVLEAETHNAGALAMYEGLGFIRDKRLERYFGAALYPLGTVLMNHRVPMFDAALVTSGASCVTSASGGELLHPCVSRAPSHG